MWLAHRGTTKEDIRPPPENFKTLHSKFDICRNFQRMKMKFRSKIIFKKSYLKFFLSHRLIIALQDLS